MNISLKILSSATSWPGYPIMVDDTRETSSPIVSTYATYSFYNADNDLGAKVLLLDVTGKYALRRPITVTLKEENDDEYIACFEEAMLSRSGETPRQAIDWLKSSVVTLYDVLKKKDPKKLGPLPSRQLKVLGDYLVAEPNPKA
jgi:hypothetical protein